MKTVFVLSAYITAALASFHSSDVHSVSVHTSHMGDNLSYRLTTGMSDEIMEAGSESGTLLFTFKNSPYELWCSVVEGVTMNSCSWTHNDGGEMVVEGSGLVDNSGNAVAGISVNTSEPNTCHIKINSLTANDKGTWMCKIEHSGSQQHQEAYLEIVENRRDTYIRLPSNVVPDRYKLYLMPFIVPDNFTIAGYVSVLVNVSEPSNNITIHINDMVIHESSVEVVDENDMAVPIQGHGYDEARQFYIMRLRQPLAGAQATVNIYFTGNLNGDLAGFYRSSYTNPAGEKKWIATSQFEATDARRAFPCFDEPAMKAKFQINLARTADYTSISNMPIEIEGVLIPGTEYYWDVYVETLKMSTYLIAFVVSDFVYRDSHSQPEFRIWSRESAEPQTEYASNIGHTILNYYEGYFNVSFPLPKQDMIAVPDFSAGAMENWGLITYREVALLYEEGKSSKSDKEYVAVVVAHELAHQWFGDLVTMEWWSDLWLNEGFASYMEYIGAPHVEPNNGLKDRFVLNNLQPALMSDSLLSSHPISVPVNHPDEINEIFDNISYLKGSSVIRMMANFLGIPTFDKGITNYLKENAFGNAEKDILWSFLTQAGQADGSLVGNQTIKTIMDTWTLQTGYPVLKVSRQYGGSGKASAAQSRFLLVAQDSDRDSQSWWIPLSFTKPGGNFNDTSCRQWMTNQQATSDVTLTGISDTEAVIFNVLQTGFYRVNYDDQNWNLIADAMASSHNDIHRINRAQIIDDSMNLARAGLLNYDIALSQTAYLTEEEDFIPWSAALSGFTYLEQMLSRTPGYGDLRDYLIQALGPLYNRLGFDANPQDDFLSTKLRTKMLSTLCEMGHNNCTEKSLQLFNSLMSTPSDDSIVPADISSTVYCTALREGGQPEWEFLWNKYLHSNNGNEKNTILSSLGCTTEVWLLQGYLDMILDESSGVRKQDAYRVFNSVAQNTIGRYLAWNFLRAHWSSLAVMFDTAISSSISRFITGVTSDFNTEWDLKELNDFIEEHSDELGSALRATQQAQERTTANINWINNHYTTIINWLEHSLKRSR